VPQKCLRTANSAALNTKTLKASYVIADG